ncbi:MAG: hypothetical protein ACE5GI_03495 [Candidatus Aminicenantales bacterium]
MKFLFVQDYHHKYRYFCLEQSPQIQVKFSRWQKIWDKARKKLMLLPAKTLYQEQALAKGLKLEEEYVHIMVSGLISPKKLKTKFYFFLQKQRAKHILFLIGETLLLPISGLAAILPGPNVFFGILALLMITHWQALRGTNRLLKKTPQFIPTSFLKEWEEALKSKKEDSLTSALEKISSVYGLPHIRKLLWK